jgi:hypothetical protein
VRKSWSRAISICGGVLIVGAIAFRAFAVPAIVRFPDHLDTHLRFTGTYTSYFDETTMQRRAHPQVLRFALDRHLRIVHSTFSSVVIREDLVMHEGTQRAVKQQNQYVMNRRTMQLEGGADSWAFEPANRVDRSGSYRLQFPFGIDPRGHYDVWNNETGAVVVLVSPSAVHHHKESTVSVIDFTGRLDHPVTPAYRRWLAANGFPLTVPATQIQAQLKAEGVDVTAALAAVAGRLSPEEQASLSTTLSTPVPLEYRFVYDGLVSLEPHTGALVDVHTQREGLSVKPDLSGVAKLRPLLDRYASVPAVSAVVDALDRLTNRPADLAAEFRFTESAASSRSVGNDVQHQIRLMAAAELWAPWSAGLLGAALLATSLLARRRRRESEAAHEPLEIEDHHDDQQRDDEHHVLVLH